MKKFTTKEWLLVVVTIIVLLIIYFVIAAHITPNTQNAYARTYVAEVSSQVSGKITHIYIQNNQPVKKGMALLQIDPRPYRYAYDVAISNLGVTRDHIAGLKAQIQQNQSTIMQKQVDLATAQTHLQEIQALAKNGYATTADLIDKRQAVADNQAALQAAKDELKNTIEQLGESIDGVNIHIVQAKAKVANALFNLNSSTIYAPVDGTVINFHLAVGNYANPGQTLLAVAQSNSWWVIANIRENCLARIKTNQKVWVSLSMYPGRIFHGHVVDVGRAVNLQSNIPNNYAPFVEKTQDWIRIAQRFPVQILLDDFPRDKTLRSGASAYVTIVTGKHVFWNSLGFIWQWIYSLFEYIS